MRLNRWGGSGFKRSSEWVGRSRCREGAADAYRLVNFYRIEVRRLTDRLVGWVAGETSHLHKG
jgi:hypothetical protein